MIGGAFVEAADPHPATAQVKVNPIAKSNTVLKFMMVFGPGAARLLAGNMAVVSSTP